MTLLSAAIISASDANFSIQAPTGNAVARSSHHQSSVISRPTTNTDDLLKGPRTNNLESHATPTFYSMVILFTLPTVHKKLPYYKEQSPS